MHRTTVRTTLLLVVALLAAPLGAQQLPESSSPAPAATVACDYLHYALGIVPVWNGLAVVQGQERTQLATLHFFVPRNVTAAFQGDSARAWAGRAFATRRVAAALTDGGGLLLAVALVRGLSVGRLDTAGRGLAVAGGALFGASVPLQFSADAALSRAVWWHNSALGGR